ncbi:MAG: hypothetical protein ACK5TK_14510 [Betaproteobacteria bacterium]
MRQRLLALAAASAAAAFATGCAPDAWQNVRATGLNAYLDSVAANCQPLYIGQMLYDKSLAQTFDNSSQTDIVQDMTSRLYYGRMSPSQFREAMLSSWPGERTARSVDCMIAQLPPERPSSPSGNW